MRNKASSGGEKPSIFPPRMAATSSSLHPYILPPAELASIQNGHPTLTAVRSRTNERSFCETPAFWPSNHSVSTFTQKARGTRARIFCGVKSRPTTLRTFANTCRIKNGVCFGSTPSILAMIYSVLLAEPVFPCCALTALGTAYNWGLCAPFLQATRDRRDQLARAETH